MEIKDLQLTENDFKLLIDGLDALPERGLAGEMVVDLIEGIMGEGKPKNDAKIQFDKLKREREKNAKQKEKQMLTEEIKILQGKLLMFKRYLIETDALKQVNEILK